MNLESLMQLVDVNIVFLATCIVELLKMYLPDNIEARIVPILSISVCLGLSQLFGISIMTGVWSGIVASGLYKIVMKTSDKIGGNVKDD